MRSTQAEFMPRITSRLSPVQMVDGAKLADGTPQPPLLLAFYNARPPDLLPWLLATSTPALLPLLVLMSWRGRPCCCWRGSCHRGIGIWIGCAPGQGRQPDHWPDHQDRRQSLLREDTGRGFPCYLPIP